MGYPELARYRDSLGEGNDCAVIAASIATGVDYDDVHAEYKRLGRKNRGSSKPHWTPIVLKQFGFKTFDETRHWRARVKTPITAARYLPKGETYLVRCNGHIFCVKDGMVHDWTKGRRHIVRQILRVVPITKGSGPMARIYKGAKTLIEKHGLTDEQVASIKGTGAGDAIRTEDVQAFLDKQNKTATKKASGTLSQQDIIRDGLMKGLPYDEIVENVKKVFPGSKIKNTHVSWTKGNEARKNSEWHQEFLRTLKARATKRS